MHSLLSSARGGLPDAAKPRAPDSGNGLANTMLAEFTLATFEPVVGSRFSVRIGANEWIEVTLVSAVGSGAPATDHGAGQSPTRLTSFSLTFRGPVQPRLHQGTYEFTHETIGTFPLFVVPIGHDSDGATLEAVFSRID